MLSKHVFITLEISLEFYIAFIILKFCLLQPMNYEKLPTFFTKSCLVLHFLGNRIRATVKVPKNNYREKLFVKAGFVFTKI